MGLPVAVGRAARSIGALGTLRCTALAIRGSRQISRGRGHIPLLKGKRARLHIVTTIGILQADNLAANWLRVTVRVGVSSEPLGIVRKTQVQLLGIRADGQVRVDSIQGALNTAGVHGDIVTAVHQIIAHDVDHIHGLEDLGALLFSEGDHVLRAARDGDGECLVADGFLYGGEELGVGVDFRDFVAVRDLLVVLAVAAGVFPVNVYIAVRWFDN